MNKDERIAALEEKLEPIEGRTERIWAKNAFVDFPVYRAPTDLLVLNASNRRFRAEAQDVERDLERRLDPLNNPDDEVSVISLLLDKDPHVDNDKVVGKQSNDTDALIIDWAKRQQERPLWIRPDGMVSNGNRRLAMLKRLQATQGREGYDWVDVIVLDEATYDDETLFEMEAREQLTEGLKVRYSDLNMLLTLKDAADALGIDWHDPDAIEETAHKIQDLVASGPAYAKVQLQAIKYMTAYLQWIGAPDEYPRLLGKVERFRDVGKNMAWVAAEYADREPEMLEICFQAIKVGMKHPDLRELRRILKTEDEQFDRVVQEVESIEEEAGEEDEDEVPAIVGAEGDEDEDEDEDEEDRGEDDEEPKPSGGLSPKQQQIHRAITHAVERSRDARNADPVSDVRRAAELLARIDPGDLVSATSGGERDRVVESIRAITTWSGSADDALRATGDAED